MTLIFKLHSTHRNVHGAVLISAGSLVAHLAVATAGAVRPGKVASLADELSTSFPGAPQFGAGLHVWTGLRASTESKLTLTVQAVDGAGQVV